MDLVGWIRIIIIFSFQLHLNVWRVTLCLCVVLVENLSFLDRTLSSVHNFRQFQSAILYTNFIVDIFFFWKSYFPSSKLKAYDCYDKTEELSIFQRILTTTFGVVLNREKKYQNKNCLAAIENFALESAFLNQMMKNLK